MRLHLESRLDMTSNTSSRPTHLNALQLLANTFTCHMLTSLAWMPFSVSPHFLTHSSAWVMLMAILATISVEIAI